MRLKTKKKKKLNSFRNSSLNSEVKRLRSMKLPEEMPALEKALVPALSG
jgi:hypothetical protein